MTLILSNGDAEKLLTMPECIDVLEEAYAELAEGRGVSRTRSDCFAPTSREDAKLFDECRERWSQDPHRVVRLLELQERVRERAGRVSRILLAEVATESVLGPRREPGARA